MVRPSLSSIMQVIDNRYTLVIVTAKRARQIAEGAPALIKCYSDKPVTVAANEINDNKITYVQNNTYEE